MNTKFQLYYCIIPTPIKKHPHYYVLEVDALNYIDCKSTTEIMVKLKGQLKQYAAQHHPSELVFYDPQELLRVVNAMYRLLQKKNPT